MPATSRVFDPPPAAWAHLGLVAKVAVAAVAAASSGTVRSARQPAVAVLRDL